jgi:hypothetical protein
MRYTYTDFFLGLLEGDGSIQVNHWKKRILQFRIVIKLKDTPENYRMLVQLRNHLGCMKVHCRHGYVLLIENHRFRLKILMELIESHGLLCKKSRQDYNFFRYCFYVKPAYSEFKYLKENRHLCPPRVVFSNWTCKQMTNLRLFPGWLAGFVEAEGCFCNRANGGQSFSIGQKDDPVILEAIKEFFQLPNKIQSKKNKMYVLEGGHRSSLKRIIGFFEKFPLMGEKKNAYEKFVRVFHTPRKI